MTKLILSGLSNNIWPAQQAAIAAAGRGLAANPLHQIMVLDLSYTKLTVPAAFGFVDALVRREACCCCCFVVVLVVVVFVALTYVHSGRMAARAARAQHEPLPTQEGRCGGNIQLLFAKS